MRKNKGDVFMTAKELDIMVNAMRTKCHKIDSRLDITDSQCILWYSNLEGERCYLILWSKNDHYK